MGSVFFNEVMCLRWMGTLVRCQRARAAASGGMVPFCHCGRAISGLRSVYVFSGVFSLRGGDNEGLLQDETNSHAGISGHRFDIFSHDSGPERARVHVNPCGGLITVQWHALSAERVGSVRRLVPVWEFGVCTRRGLIRYVRLSTAEGDGRREEIWH